MYWNDHWLVVRSENKTQNLSELNENLFSPAALERKQFISQRERGGDSWKKDGSFEAPQRENITATTSRAEAKPNLLQAFMASNIYVGVSPGFPTADCEFTLQSIWRILQPMIIPPRLLINNICFAHFDERTITGCFHLNKSAIMIDLFMAPHFNKSLSEKNTFKSGMLLCERLRQVGALASSSQRQAQAQSVVIQHPEPNGASSGLMSALIQEHDNT
ncbi:uncharacterized protein V6R79_013370 [Siganus canaliculatus]